LSFCFFSLSASTNSFTVSFATFLSSASWTILIISFCASCGSFVILAASLTDICPFSVASRISVFSLSKIALYMAAYLSDLLKYFAALFTIFASFSSPLSTSCFKYSMILKRCGISSYPFRTSIFVVSTINPFFASLNPYNTMHGISLYLFTIPSCLSSLIARYLRLPDSTSYLPFSSMQTVSGVNNPYT